MARDHHSVMMMACAGMAMVAVMAMTRTSRGNGMCAAAMRGETAVTTMRGASAAPMSPAMSTTGTGGRQSRAGRDRRGK